MHRISCSWFYIRLFCSHSGHFVNTGVYAFQLAPEEKTLAQSRRATKKETNTIRRLRRLPQMRIYGNSGRAIWSRERAQMILLRLSSAIKNRPELAPGGRDNHSGIAVVSVDCQGVGRVEMQQIHHAGRSVEFCYWRLQNHAASVVYSQRLLNILVVVELKKVFAI